MPTLLQRFLAKVQRSAGPHNLAECWPWMGGTNTRGYGRFWAHGRLVYAHRFMLQYASGRAISAGLHVCHKCDNPRCCRPSHLFVGTQQDNMRDCAAKGRWYVPPKRTHCSKGHSYTPENTRIEGRGTRVCIECERTRCRERYRVKHDVHPTHFRRRRSA